MSVATLPPLLGVDSGIGSSAISSAKDTRACCGGGGDVARNFN